jgi:lysophospholipase L1-like esterase
MSNKFNVFLSTGDSTSWQNYEAGGDVYAHLILDSILSAGRQAIWANKGLGGMTSPELLAIMDMWILRVPFDLITIGIGMNDALNTSGITAADFAANLEAVVDKIRTKALNINAEIILCAPSNTTDVNHPDVDDYRAAMQGVATAKGTLFCDFADAFDLADVATHTTDTIHPNIAGHADIHALLLPVVQATSFYASLPARG